MPSETLRVLMNGLIDYAGLFPPAALDMATALRNYGAYRAGEYAWMLGRFVLPAARKGEVDASWPLAVLAQQSDKMRRIGLLTSLNESDARPQAGYSAFESGYRNSAGALDAICKSTIAGVEAIPI